MKKVSHVPGFAFLGLMALLLTVHALSQAVTGPVITPVTPLNGATVKADSRGMVTFWVKGQTSSDSSIKHLWLKNPNGATFVVNPRKGDTRTLILRLGWDTRTNPAGTYTTKAHLEDWNGRMAEADITVTLVK